MKKDRATNWITAGLALVMVFAVLENIRLQRTVLEQKAQIAKESEVPPLTEKDIEINARVLESGNTLSISGEIANTSLKSTGNVDLYITFVDFRHASGISAPKVPGLASVLIASYTNLRPGQTRQIAVEVPKRLDPAFLEEGDVSLMDTRYGMITGETYAYELVVN